MTWPDVAQPGTVPVAAIVREREAEPPPLLRTVKITRACDIAVRPVHWLWDGRIPLGSLALIAGREGIGKSTVGYQLAADLTRGRLHGRYADRPRSVVVAATEDSWEHTIVPRLMAAGADLARVLRVDVACPSGVDTGLSLPRDLTQLERIVHDEQVALILLDPLMSRLDGKLDTHKDSEVRLALEPLTALADRTGSAVLGLIHVNKGSGSDPLTLIMGSRAFAAVARAVLFVMTDPDDDTLRLLGQEKNNLGRADLPTLTFRIESARVCDTEEGPVYTGRLVWGGETQRTIRDALETAGEGVLGRSATGEAAGWLEDHLTANGGTDDSASIKEAGRKAGHSKDTLIRALKRLNGTTEAHGFPRRTFWSLPGTQPSGRTDGESATTTTTATTATTATAVGAVGAVNAVGADPQQAATTGGAR